MKKFLPTRLLAAAFALPLGGCETLSSIGTSVGNVVAPKTPEAQIATGANSLTAATTLATTALRNDKITVAQAKAYRTILKGAGDALDDMNATLVACRGRRLRRERRRAKS